MRCRRECELCCSGSEWQGRDASALFAEHRAEVVLVPGGDWDCALMLGTTGLHWGEQWQDTASLSLAQFSIELGEALIPLCTRA